MHYCHTNIINNIIIDIFDKFRLQINTRSKLIEREFIDEEFIDYWSINDNQCHDNDIDNNNDNNNEDKINNDNNDADEQVSAIFTHNLREFNKIVVINDNNDYNNYNS